MSTRKEPAVNRSMTTSAFEIEGYRIRKNLGVVRRSGLAPLAGLVSVLPL